MACVAWERHYRSRYAARIRRLKAERDPGGGPPVVVVTDLEAERVVEFRFRQRLIVADVSAEADVSGGITGTCGSITDVNPVGK